MSSEQAATTWWWCLKHGRAERDDQVDSKGDDRVGPYATEEKARNWRQQFEARNERWDHEEERGREEGRRPEQA